MLTDTQLRRYSRHILLPSIDVVGQQKLLDSHALVVGLGGLGSAASLYLTASGVGKLTLCDYDSVDESNLQRQIVHHHSDVGRMKTDSALENLRAINPDTQFNLDPSAQTLVSLRAHCQQVQVVIDASDNFLTRLAVNQACYKTRTPLISAAAIRMEGQISVFDFRQGKGPCYACLYGNSTGELEETCSENGILAPVVGILGSMQALEAIKVLLNLGQSLAGRLLLFDALQQDWRQIKLNSDPACEVCGTS